MSPEYYPSKQRTSRFPTASSLALRQPGFSTWRLCLFRLISASGWTPPGFSHPTPFSTPAAFRPCPHSSPPRLHDDHYPSVAFAHSTSNCAELRVFSRFWASRPSSSRPLPVHQAQARGDRTGSWSGLEDVTGLYMDPMVCSHGCPHEPLQNAYQNAHDVCVFSRYLLQDMSDARAGMLGRARYPPHGL